MISNEVVSAGAAAQLPRPRTAAVSEQIVRAWPGAGLSARAWARRAVVRLILLETAFAAVAGVAVVVTRPGPVGPASPLWWACLGLVVLWPLLLGLADAYSPRVFGTGSDEYRRVARAGLFLLALAGFTSYATRLDLSRALVVLAVPALTLGTLAGRYVMRRRLHRLWARGRCMRRVVLVGRGGAVLQLAARLGAERFAGLQVVAACVTAHDMDRVRRESQLAVGALDEVLEMATRHGADAVAVTSASETAAEYLRRLSWELEGTGLELLVAPGLIEVAGPRLHIRPLEGLPLLTVEQPAFQGWRRLVKEAMDRTAAAVGLLLLAPVFVALALAVRFSDGGPVFYRQERIGVGGRPFRMFKFRSMVVDADRRLAALRGSNVSDGLLFKIPDDPRVTPVGRWMRKYSLDELPQLINVLSGAMSLVGPRPPLPSEVARYDSSVSRRLLVKPGLTGLWQISGRSDLPWEEAVRLDLRYVENWSLALDALILWKTGRAVLAGRGAY